jgi:hypothetical protein
VRLEVVLCLSRLLWSRDARSRASAETGQAERVTRIVIATLLLAAASLSPAPAESPADAYQIFARSREYWLQQHYPPLLEYTVAVTVLEGGSVKKERYWSAYDSTDGQIAVDSVSDYERSHPTYAAPGVNVKIPLLSSLVKPQPPTDYLGVPLLAPNYTFGMADIPRTNPSGESDLERVTDVRTQFHDPTPVDRAAEPSPTSGALPTIAKETVYGRNYRITLAGVESTYGVPAYHLHLQALHDPGRYRLEELWVDTRNFAPIQLVERINFVDGPGTGVPWRVRFGSSAGALYIFDETALKPMRYNGLLYPQAILAFENIHAVDELSRPPPLFDPQASLIMSEP